MVTKLSRSKIFLFSCIAFIVGIALASFLPSRWIENDLWWFMGMAGCVVVLILFYKNKSEGKQKEGGQALVHLLFVFLILLFLFLGFWRYSIGLPSYTPDKIWYYNGQIVTVQGAVCNEPDVRERNQKIEVCTENLTPQPPLLNRRGGDDNNALKITGKILITTNLYPSYNYGDELEFTCELKAPEKFQGFSYDRYLARYDIYSVCYYPLLSREAGQAPAIIGFYKRIFIYKNKLHELINLGLPEPESSLASAIILGYKRGIPEELRQNFSRAGLSHIIAISGMHISILAALLMGLLLGIGVSRKKAFWLASLFLLIYIILVGLPASAMRAGLMGFLVLWAMNLGRLNKLTNSLVLVGAILLLINPKLLRDDIGFQLSFLAVLGIAYFYPILDSLKGKIEKLPKFLKAAAALINVTISAQMFTLPILAFNFSQISLIAPISNLFVLWTLPLLMVAVLSGLVLSLIFPSFSFLFFLPSLLVLKYIIIIAEWLVKVPYAYIEVDYLWWGWGVLYYIGVVWIVIYFSKKRKD